MRAYQGHVARSLGRGAAVRCASGLSDTHSHLHHQMHYQIVPNCFSQTITPACPARTFELQLVKAGLPAGVGG